MYHFYSSLPGCTEILIHDNNVVQGTYWSWNIQKEQAFTRTARSGCEHRQELYDLVIWDRMSRYFTIWVSLGIVSPFLLAAGDIVCSEKEALFGLIPSTVTPLTDCLMECTRMTYDVKQQLQDQHNIRLKDSTEGKKTLMQTHANSAQKGEQVLFTTRVAPQINICTFPTVVQWNILIW